MQCCYLNQGISLCVNSRSGFIQNEYLRFAEKSSCETNKLSLADTVNRSISLLNTGRFMIGVSFSLRPLPDVLSSFIDCACQTHGKRGYKVPEMGVLESHPKVWIAIFICGVEVEPKRSGEENWVLKDCVCLFQFWFTHKRRGSNKQRRLLSQVTAM